MKKAKKQWCVRYRITWSSKLEEKFFNKKRDAKRFYEKVKICCDQAAMGIVEKNENKSTFLPPKL